MTDNDEPEAAVEGRELPQSPVAVEDGSVRRDPEVVSATASQRVRLVPPDGKPLRWVSRYRRHMQVAEWALILVFLGLAGYFLYFLIFSAPDAGLVRGLPPTQENFRAALRALPPMQVEASWNVPAQVGRWRRIVIHHSATPSGNPESFDRYHREARKWENGLGYHFVIGNGNGMADGEVALSRRWLEQLDGAHVKGREGNENSWSIGICLVGNFNETLPTERQLASLKGVLTFLRREYGIGLAEICGHNQVAAGPTDCPGAFFFVNEVALALANP